MVKKSFNKQRILESTAFRVFIISIIIVIFSILMTLVSHHSEFTNVDEIKKAEVAMVNDDLDLALLLYKEAYEMNKTPELAKVIKEVTALINSKYHYNQAREYENENKLESAYSYYQKVIEADTTRYNQAQVNSTKLGNQIVENIMLEAEGYYHQNLYPMVIGRLRAALQYNIRTEEINDRLAKANAHFYEYYVQEAQTSFEEYLDNEYLFDTFLTSLTYAEIFVMTDDQKMDLATVKEDLVNEAITTYLEKLEHLNEDDINKIKSYAKMILKLDPTHEKANEYLNNLEPDANMT